MINPNLEQGHHWYYWVYLTNKSTFLAFSTVPRKANFAELPCIGLIGNCANLPLDYEEVLTKSGERWWQGSMSSPETQSRCHSQKSWQELHLSLGKATLCCSPEGSKAWTLGCYGFPRAQTPSLTCLGFSEKNPKPIGPWFQPESVPLLPTKKHRQEKLETKKAISEALEQGEDRYWFCFLLLAGTVRDSLLRLSSFAGRLVFLLLLLSHFFYSLPVFSAFVFLRDPHRRSLSTTLAGRIRDRQRAFAASPYIHSCPFSY